MARVVTHKTIVNLHKDIQRFHKGLNGFYRFNFAELNGQLRSGVKLPALLLESHSSEMATNPNGSTKFNQRYISFLLVDDAVKPDAYNVQDDILEAMEDIALDVLTYLEHLNVTRNSPFYNLFDADSVKIEKVGPVFGQLFGWNVLYRIKNKEPMLLDPDKWDFTATE